MRTDCALLNRTRLHFCFLVCKETFWTFPTKITWDIVIETEWYHYQFCYTLIPNKHTFRKKLVILNICAFYWSKCQWVWVPKSNDSVLLLIFYHRHQNKLSLFFTILPEGRNKSGRTFPHYFSKLFLMK